MEEEVLVEDNNGDEKQDRIRTKAQNDSLVVYVGNCVQAQEEVCRFARSVTERISTRRPHTSATPNEHQYKYWETVAQSTPTGSPRSDESPKPEQDVNGRDSKSADINAESASLDALIREQQLLKQKIERIEQGNTSSGDTNSSNQDLVSQLQQLLTNRKQPDSHSEPADRVQDPLSQIRNLLGVGAQPSSYQDLVAQFRQYLEGEKLTNPALRDPPEQKKAAVKFHDAIGRKFNFPFHLCAKWRVRVISMASRHC